MTGNEYQELAMRTNDGGCKKRLINAIDKSTFINVAELLNGVLGLSGEAGEATDIVKKAVFHKHPFDVNTLIKELGDVMWYVAMCCNALNISLDDVMKSNIEKLSERYPDGFSTEASINRKELKEDG